MSKFLPKSVQNLIEEFSKLPGIGPKSAQRLAIYLLHSPESRTKPLGESILNLRKNVIFCKNCWNIAEDDPCKICADERRDQRKICVVEEILDVAALEKTSEYDGVYHVLHGALSPINGVGVEQLKMCALFERIKSLEEKDSLQELILATNPSLEGEATALYIQKHLQQFIENPKFKITRIARGLPVGGDLDYADEITLGRALSGRSEFL